MSTERQQYSAEIQSAAIEEYAQQRRILIVAKYADEGRSGLTFDGRPGLQSLVADVQDGQISFEILIVYDVSRWGRFQDADESAYYEFLCRKSGIEVVYCAEQFINDCSPTSTIIKSIKRVMAGEFSRELSKKTFHGQCRLAEKGCWVGAVPGYGLRRLLVDQFGIAKFVLAPGEQKNLQTDRVVLVPGPPEEVAVVARIYRLFLDGRMSINGIVTLLNEEGIVTDVGRRWTRAVVTMVLTNEKYLGHNVFNRTSKKLKSRTVRNPDHLWIRSTGAFPPVIDVESFERVRACLKRKSPRYKSQAMIDDLVQLAESGQTLCERVINQQPDMATAETYRARFGSLDRAYILAGVRTRLTDDEMLQDLVSLSASVGCLTNRKIRMAKGALGPDAYRRRFGNLENAYKLAGLPICEPLTNAKLLADLVELHRQHGNVAERTLRAHREVACAHTYRKRFGSMHNAYKLAGIFVPEPFTNERMLADLIRLYPQYGRLTHRALREHKDLACGETYRKRFGGLSKAYEIVGLA